MVGLANGTKRGHQPVHALCSEDNRCRSCVLENAGAKVGVLWLTSLANKAERNRTVHSFFCILKGSLSAFPGIIYQALADNG